MTEDSERDEPERRQLSREQKSLLAKLGTRDGAHAFNEALAAKADSEASALLNFSNIDFDKVVDFSGVTFTEDVYFKGATFANEAYFNGAIFTNKAHFQGAKFLQEVHFDGALFQGRALFTDATFQKTVLFIGAKFRRAANFVNGTFQHRSDFTQSTFSGGLSLDDATIVDSLYFDKAKFNEYVSFACVNGERPTLAFIETDFGFLIPDFSQMTESAILNFDSASFRLPTASSKFGRTVQCLTGLGFDERPNAVGRLRVLRGLVAKSHNPVLERRLYNLELSLVLGREWTRWKNTALNSPHDLLLFVKTLLATVSITLYRCLSWYGRTAALSFLWLIVATVLFFCLYKWSYIELYAIDTVLTPEQVKSLRALTLSNLLPVALSSRPAYTVAVEQLFGQGALIPFRFQVLSLLQGATTVVLLFLMGLGLRNFFRLK